MVLPIATLLNFLERLRPVTSHFPACKVHIIGTPIGPVGPAMYTVQDEDLVVSQLPALQTVAALSDRACNVCSNLPIPDRNSVQQC